jgi:hypothetical protein
MWHILGFGGGEAEEDLDVDGMISSNS